MDLFVPVSQHSRSSSAETVSTDSTGATSATSASKSTSLSSVHAPLTQSVVRHPHVAASLRSRYTISATDLSQTPKSFNPDQGANFGTAAVPLSDNNVILRRVPRITAGPTSSVHVSTPNQERRRESPPRSGDNLTLNRKTSHPTSPPKHTANVAALVPNTTVKVVKSHGPEIGEGHEHKVVASASSVSETRIKDVVQEQSGGSSPSQPPLEPPRSSRLHSCPPPAFPSDFYIRFPEQVTESTTLPLTKLMKEKQSRHCSPTSYQTNTTPPHPDTLSSKPRVTRRGSISASSSNLLHSGVPGGSEQSTFYHTVHYYDSCPHSSPPATRPLNIQPSLDKSVSSLPKAAQTTRSVIQGSCFDCDTASRRNMEAQILRGYEPAVSWLVSDLGSSVSRLEKLSLATDSSGNLGSDSPSSAAGCAPEDCLTDCHDMDFYAACIHDLEYEIAEITNQRDQEVKTVWQGFTQRWGMGTLGIANSSGGGRKIPARTRTGESTSDIGNYVHPGISIKPSPKTFSRQRSGSTEKVSNAIRNGKRPEQDKTPDGRMRLGWIRD